MPDILIYHFLFDSRVGGNHVYVRALQDAMSDEYKSKIVTNGKGEMSNLALFKIRHIWRPLYFLELIINSIFILVLFLFGKIQRNNVLFHVHGGASLSPIFSALLLRIPVVWTIHETIPSYRPMVFVGLFLLKFCNHRVIVVANSSKYIYAGLHDAYCIPSSVNVNFWNGNLDLRSESALAWDGSSNYLKIEPIRFLAVGNINPIKGFDFLINSLSKFKEPWTLKIVGSPLDTHQDYFLLIKNLANDVMTQRKDCKIDLIGWREDIEIRALLAGCDIFVLTSISEACPICLLEAMSMGCYCLASNVGDVSVMLKDYKDSCVFLPNDENAFLRCLQNLDLAALKVRSHTKGDYQYDISHYSHTSIARSYENIYLALIK